MGINELILRSKFVQKAIKEQKKKQPDVAFPISSGMNYPGSKRVSAELKTASLMNTSYTCMDKRAKRIAAPGNYVKKGDKKITDHWFYDLIADPNSHTNQTWTEIKQLISYWLDWSGNAYLWMRPNGIAYPVQVWVLPSYNVTVLKAKDTFVQGYEFVGSGGVKHFIPKEEMCHFRTLIPSIELASNFLIGTPKMVQAVQNMILADYEAARYVKEYFERDGIPPLIMQFPGKIDPTKLAQMKAHWNDALDGDRIQGIIDQGATVQPLERLTKTGSDNFVQSDSVNSEILEAITSAFEVPSALLLPNAANYATMKEIKNDFMTDVIDPLITSFEHRLTLHLRHYDSEIVITHDSVKEDNKLQSFKTLNEQREDEGLPALAQDIPMHPKDLTPIVIPTIEDKPDIEDVTEDAEKSLKSEDAEEKIKVIYWKSFDKISLAGEKAIKKATVSVFEDLQDEIIGNLSKKKNIVGVDWDVKADLNAELFDEDSWTKTLESGTESERSTQAAAALKETLKRIKETLKPTEFEKEVAKRTKASTSKISGSMDVIQKDLTSTIRAIIADNPLATEAELRRMIIEAVDAKFQTNYLDARAGTIARTTSTFITANTQHSTMNMFNRKYVWLSRRDAKVRTSHRKMDGKKPNRKGIFNVNGDRMKHPGSGSVAKENVNCRCQLHPLGVK